MEDPLSLEVHAFPGKLTRPSEVLEILDEEEIRGCAGNPPFGGVSMALRIGDETWEGAQRRRLAPRLGRELYCRVWAT